MTRVRPQYHLRPTDEGLWAWNVHRLIDLSKDLPIKMIKADEFAELDKDHWYFHGNVKPTCRNIIEHLQLIEACELSHPIILDQSGRVMDGMHRICKAVIEAVDQVPAVQFATDPEPDYKNCDPEELLYCDIQQIIEQIAEWANRQTTVCGLAIVGL